MRVAAAAFAAQLVGRARRVGLRRHPRRIRAPARLFELGELLRAQARRVLVAAVAPFEPIERDHETEAELRTVGPARPQRRREQRQVTALDRGRDEIPRIAVAPLREHAGDSRLRTEPGEHAVAEPFVFVERAAQRARARTPQEAAAVEPVQVPKQRGDVGGVETAQGVRGGFEHRRQQRVRDGRAGIRGGR